MSIPFYSALTQAVPRSQPTTSTYLFRPLVASSRNRKIAKLRNRKIYDFAPLARLDADSGPLGVFLDFFGCFVSRHEFFFALDMMCRVLATDSKEGWSETSAASGQHMEASKSLSFQELLKLFCTTAAPYVRSEKNESHLVASSGAHHIVSVLGFAGGQI